MPEAHGHATGRLAVIPAAASVALTLIVAVQIGALHYSASRYIPTTSDTVAGGHLIELVRRTPGPVIVADHPYYDTLAGKASWAQGEAVHDILRAGPSQARADLQASIGAVEQSSQPRDSVCRRSSIGSGHRLGAVLPADANEGLRLWELLLPRDGSQASSGLRLRSPLTWCYAFASWTNQRPESSQWSARAKCASLATSAESEALTVAQSNQESGPDSD